MTQSPNRVECPACGKEIALRKNGRFWQHNNGEPQYPGSIWMQTCKMSGQIDTDSDDSDWRYA